MMTVMELNYGQLGDVETSSPVEGRNTFHAVWNIAMKNGKRQRMMIASFFLLSDRRKKETGEVIVIII